MVIGQPVNKLLRALPFEHNHPNNRRLPAKIPGITISNSSVDQNSITRVKETGGIVALRYSFSCFYFDAVLGLMSLLACVDITVCSYIADAIKL